MRKISSMFIAAFMCVALVGCGGSSVKDAASSVEDGAEKVEGGAAMVGDKVPGADKVEGAASATKDAAGAIANPEEEGEK